MKTYKYSMNHKVPVEQISCRVKACGEEFGGAWRPHSTEWGMGENIDLSFDDLNELYEFQSMVNKFVDALQQLMDQHKENAIELFVVRGEKS